MPASLKSFSLGLPILFASAFIEQVSRSPVPASLRWSLTSRVETRLCMAAVTGRYVFRNRFRRVATPYSRYTLGKHVRQSATAVGNRSRFQNLDITCGQHYAKYGGTTIVPQSNTSGCTTPHLPTWIDLLVVAPVAWWFNLMIRLLVDAVLRGLQPIGVQRVTISPKVMLRKAHARLSSEHAVGKFR
jgi:hypothetical protein